jgi:hypothetical protein
VEFLPHPNLANSRTNGPRPGVLFFAGDFVSLGPPPRERPPGNPRRVTTGPQCHRPPAGLTGLLLNGPDELVADPLPLPLAGHIDIDQL